MTIVLCKTRLKKKEKVGESLILEGDGGLERSNEVQLKPKK